MRLGFVRWSGVVLAAIVLCVCFAPIASAGEEEGHGSDRAKAEHLEKILRGLHSGIQALRALGGHEELAAHLERVGKELRRHHAEDEHRMRERAREHEQDEEEAERRALKERVAALRLALPALHEAEKHDAIEAMELTVRAGEMLLAGRQDEEARALYERIPGLEDRVEILRMAAEIWRRFDHPRNAEALTNLANYYAQRLREHREGEGREGAEDHEAAEREHAEHRKREARKDRPAAKRRARQAERLEGENEILRLAMKALLEAEKHDWAERVEMAIHANELLVAGRKDREAKEIVKKAPNAGQRAELLHAAAKLWQEFGHEEKAKMVAKLGQHYGQMWHAQRKKAEAKSRKVERERPGQDDVRATLEQLQKEVRELQAAFRRLQRELKKLAVGLER